MGRPDVSIIRLASHREPGLGHREEGTAGSGDWSRQWRSRGKTTVRSGREAHTRAGKTAWRLVLALLIVAVAAGALWVAAKGRTPSIRGADGRILPGSIASLERVRLGGIDQAVLLRGRSIRNPVLLFLHGGPGMPAMYLAHRWQRPLEARFVVVHWDQRGAGKSYGPSVRPESMTVERFVADATQLIESLRTRFRVDRIYLIGHSWGSYLGLLVASRIPDRLAAYVGTGQVADEARARLLADEFVRRRARETGREEALGELAQKGGEVREKWLFRFGAVLHRSQSWWPLLGIGLAAPEYTFRDILSVARGPAFAGRHMRYDAIAGPLMDSVTSLEVPLYFFLGRHDWNTPSVLAEDYFRRLTAPRKHLVWFEESAHFPFFEEPKKFAGEMFRVLEETSSTGGGQTSRHRSRARS